MVRLKTKEVLILVPISRSKLDSWIFRGLIVPTEPSRGQGYPSRYSVDNVIQFQLVQLLSEEAGMILKRASQIAFKVVQHGGKVYLHLGTGAAREAAGSPKPMEVFFDIEKMQEDTASNYKLLKDGTFFE